MAALTSFYFWGVLGLPTVLEKIIGNTTPKLLAMFTFHASYYPKRFLFPHSPLTPI